LKRIQNTKIIGASGVELQFDIAYEGLGRKYYVDILQGKDNFGELDILKEYPGSFERLDRLDAILSSYYGDMKDARAEVDTLETHLRAKLDYPYGGGYTYSTDYEMHQPYFRAIQENPDKAEMLMEFVRSNPQNSLSRRAFRLLATVWKEMPERAEEFTRKVNDRGIDDARSFLDERGYEEFDKDTITAYLDTAGAISEGWL
jgi:hypothetical protein